MKPNITLNLTMLILAVAGVGLAWYFGKKGLEAVKAGAAAVNPLNNENVFNKGATNAAQAVGLVDENSTIGGTLFEGVQKISSWFTGKPTDNELILQQPKLPAQRMRELDSDRQ